MVLTSEPMFSRVLPPTVSKFESLSNPPPQQPVHPLSPSRLEVVIELPAQTSRFATGVCGEKMIFGEGDFGWFGADMVIPCSNILSAYWYYHHVQNRRNKDHGTLWTLFQRDFHQHGGRSDRTSDSIIPTTKGSSFTSCKWCEAETSLVIGGIK